VGAIVVYEIVSNDSFQKVKKWVAELREHANKDIVIAIAGNKSDMEKQRRISKIEA
jgi:GTPase SAR1 family protein